MVDAGTEFELFLPGREIPNEFVVDIGDASILFSATVGVGNISGLGPVTISDLDWVGMTGAITGFIFSTNIPGIDDLRLSFTADSFSVDFDGLNTSGGQFLQIDLTVSDVPEPATLSLFLIGLVGIGIVVVREKQLT